MITSVLMFCAEGVVIDKKSNNASIFNILEQANAASFPMSLFKLTAFSLLERTEEDTSQIDCELIIKNDATELAKFPLKVDFKNRLRSRTIIEIGGIIIPNSGALKFSLFHEGRELDSYTINVYQRKGPKAQVKPT